MSKLSLCMIVKNEEDNISRCLKSVIPVADQIIVIDTGSKDKTVELAKEYGAEVQYFLWNNNFSDARNVSLDLATGDWILFVDADEELTRESQVILRKLLEDETVEGYFIKIINYIGNEGWTESCPDLVFRMFRNNPEYRFHGAIHEQVVDVILKVNPKAKYSVAENVVLNHYGYLNQQIEEKNKKQRNLSIIEKEISLNPDNRLLRYHYGVELYRSERYDEAAHEFVKAAKGIDPHTIYLPKLLRYIILSYHAAKQYDRALDTVNTTLKLYPNYTDIYYYAGLIHYEQKNYGMAYDYFQKTLITGKQPAYYASFSGLGGVRAYYYLGELAQIFCNEEEAVRYYILSINDNPAFVLPLEKLCCLLRPWEDPDGAKAALEKLFDFSEPKAKLAVAGILFKQHAYSLVLDYLDSPVCKSLLAENRFIWRLVCLIQQRRFFEALKAVEQFTFGQSNYPLVQLNKLICFWLQGSTSKVLSTADELFSIGLSNDTSAVIELILQTVKPKEKKIDLGEKGFSLLHDILTRLLDLQEIKLFESLLSGLSEECIKRNAQLIGQTLLKYFNYELAEYYLKIAIEYNPNSEIYGCFAEIYEQKGMYTEAEGLYRKAWTADPKMPKFYIRLMRLYQTMKIDILKRAVTQYPETAVFCNLLKEVEARA